MTLRSPAKDAGLAPRSAPVQARAHRTRQSILDATHALLKAHGVHQLTTVLIAQACGISIGALYRLFPNKEAIVCSLYEEKLAAIRALGLANRRGAAGRTPWRAFFESYFRALKAAEQAVDFDFSLADAILMLPQLWEIEKSHGVLFADQMVVDLKAYGASWSDAALFDLSINVFALDASTWLYWRYARAYPAMAIERLLEAALGMLRPALEGEPEPVIGSIAREDLVM